MESRLRAVPKTLRVFTLWTLALSLLALPAFAQDGAVSGTVTDADGDPLPGVLVSVEGGGDAMISGAMIDDTVIIVTVPDP